MTDHQDTPRIDEELVPEDDAIIGVAMRWSLLVAVFIILVVVGVLLTRRDSTPEPVVIERTFVPPDPLVQDAPDMSPVRFTDITTAAGIDFVHQSGATGEKLLPETMGGGCALFDYDGDDDPDILFVNGTPWPHDAKDGPAPTMALYRNDGRGSFENVSVGSGLDDSFLGQGVACGDYDNDGDVDVFVTALGPNRLFRNDGGRFVNVTGQTGVAGRENQWSTSAGFFDADNDGDLDLFVCNYVEWSREIDLEINYTLNGTDRAYGPPVNYQGTDNLLYRNDGDGTFTEIGAAAGIHVANPATGRPMGKALAATFVDVDRDGRLDIIVANDTVQNFLFRNRGGASFEEVGAASGVAFSSMGTATGAMGMDAVDYGNDGRLAVGIGNFANESTSLYVQQARDPWQFADMAGSEGIGSPSRRKLTFGLFFFDYDLDGRLDLLQANGHLEEEISEVQASQRYRQSAQLFWNCGPEAKSCFVAVPEDQTGDLSRPIVGRGASYADLDGDGDLDVLLTQTGGPPLLLRNDQALGHHWLRVRLVGATCNGDAIGAWIELDTGGTTQRRQVMPTRSYLSQVELPVTFGLGSNVDVAGAVLRVSWPGGGTVEMPVPGVDRLIVIEQKALGGR